MMRQFPDAVAHGTTERHMNPCSCGSGLQRRPIYDGYCIFLTYVCDQCETEKVGHFRPDIFERYQCDEPIEPEDY